MNRSGSDSSLPVGYAGAVSDPLYVVAHGLLARRPVYDDFVKGAKDGLQTVLQILPTLVGLMAAVGVLRASGFLDFLSAGAAAG